MSLIILKKICTSFIAPLCNIINKSFHLGIFPKQLKLARITPVYKKGDKTNPTNFRPISSLHYISKIFEKLLAKRLLSFFDRFSLFAPSQYGFLIGYSTADAILNLTEMIYNSLNRKDYHISVFVDIKKAFDSISHTILINKLEKYGIRGPPLRLLSSYLADRESYVACGLAKSENRISNIGIPQGSILGPVLFLIYVNDLPNFAPSATATLFADDTTISVSDKNFDICIGKLQFDLEMFSKWTLSNRLSVNVAKTEALIFSNRLFHTENANVAMNSQILEFGTNCKYLGVLIDQNLKFMEHINYILEKLSRNTGILYSIRHFLPKSAKLNFYYALFYPHLNYNIVIWGGTSNQLMKKLSVQQKRIVRIICDAHYRAHTNSLFYDLGILKVFDVYRLQILIRMYKSKSLNLFSCRHNVNTRQRNLAVPTFQRLTSSQKSFSYIGPTMWNEIPSYIRELKYI